MSLQLVSIECGRQVPTLEERVRTTVHQLCVLTRGATLDFAMKVGKVVVETLYDGDLSAWRSRARKDHALRALASSPDLPMSASALYRALAIYELSRRQIQVTSWRHLGVSHLRTVLGLPCETQNRLLAKAEVEQWTVARLEREALALRMPSRSAGGRRPVPACVRSIRRIFDLTLPEALEGLDLLHELGRRDVEELAEKLSQARDRLHRIERILSRNSAIGRPGRRAVASSS